MYYIYAIKSILHNRIYVGLTRDLELRLREHNSGRTKSTKYYRPWEIFYTEEASSLKIAREREKKLKSGCGKELLKELLKDCACSSFG